MCKCGGWCKNRLNSDCRLKFVSVLNDQFHSSSELLCYLAAFTSYECFFLTFQEGQQSQAVAATAAAGKQPGGTERKQRKEAKEKEKDKCILL